MTFLIWRYRDASVMKNVNGHNKFFLEACDPNIAIVSWTENELLSNESRRNLYA